ncbi:MAG: DUF948 domain-containing protein [Bacteroidota bacterium]
METLVELSKIAALLSASALCIYLIVVLIRLKAVLETIQHEIVELNKYLKPVLENLAIISDKMRAIASKIDDQVNMINGVFVAFRRISDNIVRFEGNIQDILEKPFSQIGLMLSTIFSRFGSFFGSKS